MMNILVVLVTCLFACNLQSKFDDISVNNLYYIHNIVKQEIPHEARSKNLEFIDDIYIIYAERNDSIFKIISTEDIRIDISFLDTIKENECYYLDLENFTDGEYDIPLGNSGFFLGVNDGYLIQIPFEKEYNNKLYIASNLNGLYIVNY